MPLMGAASAMAPQTSNLFEDPSAWRVRFDDDEWVAAAPPATSSTQKAVAVGGRPPDVTGLPSASAAGAAGARALSPTGRLPAAEPPPTRTLEPQLLSRSGSLVEPQASDGRRSPKEEERPSRGWSFEDKTDQVAEPRTLRQQYSLLSSSSRVSMTEGSLQRAKSFVSSALRSIGLTSEVSTNQEIAGELFEFCLSICLATALDMCTFVEAFGYDDRKAVRRLCATARRAGLLGSTPKVPLAAPPTELARAFVAQGFEESAAARKSAKVAPRSESSASLSSAFAPSDSQKSSVHRGITASSAGASAASAAAKFASRKKEVTFDSATEDETSAENKAQTLGLPRGSSMGLARGGLDRSRSDLGRVVNLNRSISDLSCTSFTDFNRRHMATNAGAGGITVRPTFLDFVSSLGQEQRLTSAPMGDANMQVMDVVLPPSGNQAAGRLGTLDTVSEAGLSYHSSYDMASEGDEHINAEVISVNPGINGQSGTMKIAFRSRCLRTQNEWQRQLLAQQRVLLNMVSTKLKAKEEEIQAGDELRDEQKELLRGFRKIIVREVAEDEGSKSMCVFIIEKEDKVRSEMEELCRILEYPYQAFRGLSTAIAAINDESSAVGGMLRIDSEKSLNVTDTPTEDKVRVKEGPKLLEGRSDASRDWRSRALLPQSSRKSATKYRKPSTTKESDTIRIVLLGSAWLEKDLPKEWAQEEGIFVVLTSQAEDFENVGRFLLASGEAEIREKLRARGVSEYLLHPLSLEGLRGAVGQAFRRRYGDEYLLLQAVGRGTSGVVHRAKRLRDGDAFALKEINTKRMSKTAKQEVERESQLLSELRWPTVVFLVDTWENTGDRLRYILMPLLEGGSLQQYIELASKDESKKAGMERISEWYAQTLHGLTYLHWRGVLHRDLKPGNLLVTGTNDRALQIGDLGSAMLLPGYGPHPMRRNMIKGQVSTPLYAAPEILLSETYSVGSDIWAVGSSFYEVITFSTFFPSGQSIKELQSQAEVYEWKGGPWASAMQSVRSSLPPVPDMAEMMRPDPLQRPTASELIGRSNTSRRLKAVLEAVGAVTTSLDRKLHFEDLSRIRSESDSAANLNPAMATRSQAPAHSSPSASSRLTPPSSGPVTRRQPSSLGAPSSGPIRGGLARAGSGIGTSLRRASSGAVHWATGGRHSIGEDRA